MPCFTKILSVFLAGLLSCSFVTAKADETSSTVVNPATQESTTTTVNTDTNQTTVTKVNPVTQETTTTIITPAPSPQETTVIPQGYSNCFTVSAGWFQNVWVPEHRVCQYSTTNASGVAWVDGHWVCTKYKSSEGTCTKWEWKAGHWVKQFEVY
jgi:hypothetical protein